MKIGLLGGMFDPVHLGHLNAANRAAETFGLDRVFFVPTAAPPHRKAATASPEERLAMLALAVRGNPRFRVSMVEMGGTAPSYTVDTLKRFRKRHGEDVYFIIGLDAFAHIHSWKSSAELFGLCNFIVVSRPGVDGGDVMESLNGNFRRKKQAASFRRARGTGAVKAFRAQGSRYAVYLCPFPAMDVSSTGIREMLRKGLSVKYLVPEGVERYIIRERIYG